MKTDFSTNCRLWAGSIFLLISLSFPSIGYSQKPVLGFNPSIKSYADITAMAIQPDDKLLIAGYPFSLGDNPLTKIARINPDGTQDESFGFQVYPGANIYKILVDDDGKILVAGQDLKQGYPDMLLLNEDGSINTSFQLDPSISTVIDFLKLDDGSYILASHNVIGHICRINSDGSLDTSFDPGTGPNSIGNYNFDMVRQGEKIVLAGNFTEFDSQETGGIIRLNMDGSIDDTFHPGTGAATAAYSTPGIKRIGLQSDNKIILTGSFDSFNGTPVKYIVRLLEDGAVDNTFTLPGPAGNIYESSISQLLINSNDKILLLDFDINGYELFQKIIRLTKDGELDNTFTAGTMKVEEDVNYPDMIFSNDHSILISAHFFSYNNEYRNSIALIDADGVLQDFNPSPGGRSVVNTIAIQADGKIVIGGNFFEINGMFSRRIGRINSDGSLDESFSSNIGEGANFSVNKIVVQEDQKILVGGGFTTYDNTNRQLLIRLNADGSLDNAFDPQIYATYVGLGVNDILLQNDRIVVGGFFRQVSFHSINHLVGILYDGAYDNTFNSTNILGENDEINSIGVQSDGKLILGGENYYDETGAVLTRVTATGDPDATFSIDFIDDNYRITKVHIMPDDGIIFCGGYSRIFPQDQPFPIIQLDKDGLVLDNSSVSVFNGDLMDIESGENDDVLISGYFKKVNGVDRNFLGSVSLTGNLNDFNLNIQNSGSGYESIRDMYKIDNQTMLLGGFFEEIQGIRSFSGLAKINLSNDVPVIINHTPLTSIDEDTPFDLTLSGLLVEDSDDVFPDEFTLSIQSGEHYTFEGFTVTPEAEFSGDLTVLISVNDGNDFSPVYSVPVSIDPVNDIPVIMGLVDPLSTDQDVPITLSPNSLIVEDPDNTYPDEFTWTLSGGDNYSLNGNEVIPDPGFYGLLYISVTVNDGQSDSDEYIIEIDVEKINTAPVISDYSGVTESDEDTPFTFLLEQFEVTDPDNVFPDDFMLIIQEGTHFSVEDNTILPDPDYFGPVNISIQVYDGYEFSESFDISLEVLPVNDPPVIIDVEVFSCDEDSYLTISIQDLVVTDPDNSEDELTIVLSEGSNYTLEGQKVIPGEDFFGQLSVPVQVLDLESFSEESILTIQVTSVNDPPEVISIPSPEIDEDTSVELDISLFDIVDPDNTSGDLSINLYEGDHYMIDGHTIIPETNFSGSLIVSFDISDGTDNSEILLMEITVIPVNDPPVINQVPDYEISEDSELEILPEHFTIDDPDHSADQISLVLQEGEHYSFEGTILTPELNFSGNLAVGCRISDGIANADAVVMVEILPVNDIPVIQSVELPGILETNETLEITLSNLEVSDPDNVYPDDFSVVLQNGDNYSVNGNIIDPDPGYIGQITVPVQVSDGYSLSDPFQFDCTIDYTSGLFDIQSDMQVRIFPNPLSSDMLYLRSEEPLPVQKVKIFSRSGELIEESELILFEKDTWFLDVHSLIPGYYLILFNTRNQNSVKSFIKK